MKVIIPVAGIGSRLRPHTHTQPKALVPVAGKPILGHIIDSLVETGFTDFIFIIGYLGEKIESFVKDRYPHIKKEFVIQEPREGIGHAVWLARDLVPTNEEVLIVLGDTIFDVNLKEVLELPHSALGVKKVDDPRSFGVVEIDQDGKIISLVEKPAIPRSNLALVGIYRIKESKQLFEALEQNIHNDHRTRNEFHLTDGLAIMIEKGIPMVSFQVRHWFDCGVKNSLLETNAILLKRQPSTEKLPELNDSIIIQPVSIPENCTIRNSIIGPNVSIGENAIISQSIIRDSIIGSFSEIEHAVIHESIIGSDSSLKGLSQSLNIGDSTEIDFS